MGFHRLPLEAANYLGDADALQLHALTNETGQCLASLLSY